MRLCARSLTILAAFILFAAPAGWASSATSISPMVRIPGHVLPALSKATIVLSGQKSDARPITLTIVLKRDDQAGLEKYLKQIYDPRSESFHHYLTQQQIADRFGPSKTDYNQVLAYLRANRFKLVSGSANRLTLTVGGTFSDVVRAFNTRMGNYRIDGRVFYANEDDPALPYAIAGKVSSITGLSNLAQPHHTFDQIVAFFGCLNAQLQVLGSLGACNNLPNENGTPNPGNGGVFDYNACVTAVSAGGAYMKGTICQVIAPFKLAAVRAPHQLDTKAAAVPWSSVDGSGQTIGVLEFDTFVQSDVANFLSLLGAPSTEINQLSKVDVDGGVATAGSGEAEVLLDVDTTLTLAPGAQTVVYDAPFTGISSFVDVFNKMLDDKVTIISNSWSACEDQVSKANAQALDTIFQNAAAAGISVLNGSGDDGSTCLDGSANTIGVPADSPNATAVGGSSEVPGPAVTYGPEKWWNDTSTNPPAGLGGFGLSKYFSAPGYQSGLSGSPMRSIPDVVVNADPFNGVELCQADDGGCPTGKFYGGTSFAAPVWAAFTAVLNQAQGTNLGFLNTSLYPLANSAGFHNATALGSDFAHVGLGSPNVNALSLLLTGQSPGTPSATLSLLILSAQSSGGQVPSGVSADGSTIAYVTVQLLDSNGDPVPNKTVTLSAGSGNTANVTPSSGVTSASNGAVTFQVTDPTVEKVALTATDTTDDVTLAAPLEVSFVTPPASSASIVASLPSVANDGTSSSVITVTLEYLQGDTLMPAPGKLVTLSQTGSSVITGPSPQLTDSNGSIKFNVTDLETESVTYTAVDVTDGSEPVPGSAVVDFSGDPSNACTSPPPIASPGYVVTPYATGFTVQDLTTGGGQQVNFGCLGATGIAFDSSGNLYVNEFTTGNIYKFPPGGGVAGPGTKLNTLSPTLAGLVFDGSGNLFASLDLSSADSTTGSILQLDPSNGTVTRTISSIEVCPTTISIDPLSGDLFTDDSCTESFLNSSIWRVSDPGGGSPSTSVYTTLPGGPNATVAFAPDGTIYAWNFNGSVVDVDQVSGTNGPATPTVSALPGLQLANLGLLAGGTDDGTFLVGTPFANNAVVGIDEIDLTTNPPTLATGLTTKAGANYLTVGPDGCIYGSQGPTVFKITDTAGHCTYSSSLASPSIVLTPTSVSPNPAQGTSQTFSASIHYATPPAGTQILFSVTGANPQFKQVVANGSGQASFSYVAAHEGVDTISASTKISSTALTSNQAVVTWGAGSDTTFLSLNESPKGGVPGQMVNLVASLTDVSQNPATPLASETIDFSAGGQLCNAPTNAQGIATCQITASGGGFETLTASFAGATGLLASNDSTGFNVVVQAATPTATPTATATATATPTATRTATPTATPTPVAGKVKIRPKTLNFGEVEVGSDKVKSVKITNAGKIKKKRVPLPILIEMETGAMNPFSITQVCDDDDLRPRGKGMPAGSCEVSVTFTPTAAQKYSGVLMIDTNLESGADKSVKLEGVGKVPKK
jgi:Pro-kumamolisin, activation domain/Bacterial Ig-like domain (group 1)